MKNLFFNLLLSIVCSLLSGYGFTQVITIPTVFHVVWYESDPSQNLADSIIVEELQVLNEVFRKQNADSCSAAPWGAVSADCEIEFCFAQQDPQGNPTNGITHTKTYKVGFGIGDNDVKLSANGGEDIWDRDRYLNIWICNAGAGGGWSTHPGSPANVDGVVVNYIYVNGQMISRSEHKTAVAFVAEWLDLYWIEACPNCADCDSVADTPNMVGDCLPTFSCTFNDSCAAPPGPMCVNFMSSTVDSCKCLFTQGQKARMRTTLNGIRASILSSNGCMPVGVQEFNRGNGINIYPNPASGIFNVLMGELANVQIEIYNVYGECIYRQINTSANWQIDLSEAPDGIYLIRVNTKEGIISKKIIISR